MESACSDSELPVTADHGMTADSDAEMSRLRWRCRRGMKELDVVMTRYLEQRYGNASEADRDRFRQLLEMPDPELYRLLLGKDDATDPDLQHFARGLRDATGE